MSKLISFETAKLAAEVGFDAECSYKYGDIVREDILVYWKKDDRWKGTGHQNSRATGYSAPTKEELSDWLRINHKMFLSITPVVITSPEDITFKGTIFYFKDCWRLAPALNSTDYDKLYEDLLYKALTLIKSV